MTKEQRRNNFERVASKRVQDILSKIKSLENLTNTSFYCYDYKDIAKINKAITEQLEESTLILRGIKKKGGITL